MWEFYVYELFKLIVKIMRPSCGNEKLHKYISEREKTDTIKTGKLRKKLRSGKKLIRVRKKFKNRVRFLYEQFVQLDKDILLEAFPMNLWTHFFHKNIYI